MLFWWQFIGILCFRGNNPIRHHGTKVGLLNKLACVVSVSARVRRENWDKSGKKWLTGEGEGKDGNAVFSSPLPPSPSPFHVRFFFCSRSNFRAITWLETLATQARERADCSSLLLTQYTFFCLCNPTWLAHDSKLHPIKITQFFGTSTGYGKVKKKAIFESQEKYERNALPNIDGFDTERNALLNLCPLAVLAITYLLLQRDVVDTVTYVQLRRTGPPQAVFNF